MMSPRLSHFSFFALIAIYFAGCGRVNDERAENVDLNGQGLAAQQEIVYCDDLPQNVQPNNPRSGIPYEYPGEECLREGPDGEPIVDVRPGQPSGNPGQTPEYSDPRAGAPRPPTPQSPRTPAPPRTPQTPSWQTPPTYPQNPQLPGSYPDSPNNNNPDYSTPGYEGEPLPY